MKKFKKALALSLALAMGLSLVACGGSSDTTDTSSDDSAATTTESAAADDTEEATTEEAAADDTEEAATEEAASTSTANISNDGTTLNVWAWNTEFISRLADYYPGFEYNDPDDVTAGGKIGDVNVVFTITPSDDNAYQNALDAALLAQADADADSKIDIFACEIDYAKKYVEQTDYVLDVKNDLGLTDDELSTQFQYTKDVMTAADGTLRGVSWQACSSGMIYRRDIAEEVLGVSEPDDVQALVSDWDAYKTVAQQLADAGYYSSSVFDTFRIFQMNAGSAFVVDDKLNLDSKITEWVELSKEMVDAGTATTAALWGDEWATGELSDGKAFAYFGPAWFFNFCLQADTEGSVAYDGNWGFCEGPESFSWGGTWICGVNGTDNADLVADIMRVLSTDYDTMKQIAVDNSECVNNVNVLNDLGASDEGNVALLGGQNPWSTLASAAENIDLSSNLSAYDQGCVETFQNKMKEYLDGTTDYDSAYAAYVSEVLEKYPNLSE